ncbi:hypothetical protein F5X99DRAFT_396613 [Biscogniauxia marginata]|nr:hypothetical protein F5X99DRAFT_396613 [Biscogniauxia marginata]
MSHHIGHSRQLTINFCNRILEYIRENKSLSKFVTVNDFRHAKGLRNFKIDRTDLDLTTGEPADCDTNFFHPHLVENIRSSLKEHHIVVPYEPSSPKTPPAYSAQRLCFDLDDYDDLLLYSVWKQADFNAILDICEEVMGTAEDRKCMIYNGHDIKGGKTTHISCFFALWFDQEHEKLALGELVCIMAMTLHKLSEPGFENHRICPVLLFSAAFRSIRIISALVDGSTSTIHIQVTPIETFDKEFYISEERGEASDKAARMVGWRCNTPCGDTK